MPGGTQPARCERSDPFLLRHVDGGSGAAEPGGSSCLDLAEDDDVTALGDDVELTADLALRCAPIAIEDAVAETTQVLRRSVLAPAAASAAGEIAAQNSRFSRTLAALPTRSRR